MRQSACLSFRTQLESCWTDFHDIRYWKVLLKLVDTLVLVNIWQQQQRTLYMKMYMRVCSHFAKCLSGRKMFLTKVAWKRSDDTFYVRFTFSVKFYCFRRSKAKTIFMLCHFVSPEVLDCYLIIFHAGVPYLPTPSVFRAVCKTIKS
jgi:hypothetical protein